MKGFCILFVSILTLFMLSEARPSALPKQEFESQKLVKTKENLVRVRRQGFDYDDFMTNFWKGISRCTDCNILNIGNGYKNHNTVYFNKSPKSQDKDPFNSSFWKD